MSPQYWENAFNKRKWQTQVDLAAGEKLRRMTNRLAGSSIGSLRANLGDEDPGLLRDRLGRGQPLLRRKFCVRLKFWWRRRLFQELVAQPDEMT